MSSAGISLSIANNLGGVVGTVLGGFPGSPGQSFQTVPLSNTRQALYTLSIRSPTPPNAAVVSYTFPLSPASVRRESSALTSVYDVAGTPQQAGVQRIADIYGSTPLTFFLEGTTGWQYHATDNFAYTGIESVAQLQAVLSTFAAYNKLQQDNGNSNLYLLEFYDYFYQDYWQVVPVGKQVFAQSQQRPLLFEYSIQLAGIKSLSSPAQAITDSLLSSLSASNSSQAATSLTNSLNNSLGAYQPTVLGTTEI